nr:hypothetical protein [Tanacetum cinerariifolium]
CGNILIDEACLKCNSGAGNSFVYDPNPKSFNEVQSVFNPLPLPHYNIYLCQICESNSQYGYECSQRVLLVYGPEPCYNQSFGDNAYPHDSPGVTPLIDHHCCYKCGDSLDGFFCHQCTCEFGGNSAHYGYNCPSHVPFTKTLPSVPQQYFCCENYGGPHETFQSIAITLDLPTVEPKDSLRMGDEHLDTISKIESDEFMKSSVENLVPNPNESEDDGECDVPACDDFTTFSKLLFDADDDFSSSNDKSFSYENILKEIYSNPLFKEEIISMKIDSHHFNVESDLIESLLNHDSSIISSSSKIDSLLDEFADSDLLVDEIDLSFTLDNLMRPGIEDDDYDSEWGLIILEELLSNDSLSLPKNESFHFDIPSSSRPLAKPPDDEIEPNSEMLTVKMMGDISKHYVHVPRLLPTQPTLASNQKKSPHLLSHRGLKAFQLSSESPMMIYGGNIPILDILFLHFYPP